jgi:hypothetical protein
MTDAIAAVLITAVASLIVALIAGGMALWNRRRTDQNSADIQSLKGAIDRDLERLRAKLAHGQNVSATQWGAEFAAYQAIWKGIVEVQPLADKLVNREGELHQLGLPDDYLNNEVPLQYRQDLIHQLVIAAKGLLSAIHDNAPFYPAPIRYASNEAHKTTVQLLRKNFSAIAEAGKGNNIIQTREFYLEGSAILLELIINIDIVESLIRERLAAVQVVNPIVV